MAWRKIEEVPKGDDALPWLYGVARNEVSRSRRSIRRRHALQTKLGGQARHPDPSPEVVVVRKAEQERLVAALGRLKPKDQEVLRLRAYEHLTLSEVAIVCRLHCQHRAANRPEDRFGRVAHDQTAQSGSPK